MPAGTAERCVGHVAIIADARDVDIAAGTDIADIGAVHMCTRTSTPFHTATIIRTDHAGITARHGVADGTADACATGDTATAITEAACATTDAVHAS